MKKNSYSLFLVLLISLMSSLAWAGGDEDNAKANYENFCWQCHGMTGNGMGLNVQDMSVQPRDHTSAKAMRGRSDDEIHGLVKYLRKLCQCK